MRLPRIRRTRRHSRCIHLLGLFFSITGLFAQDVSVTPIEWKTMRGAPDELPTFKRQPASQFPAEVRGTTDVGYVLIETILDEKGRSLSTVKHGTVAPYLHAIDPAMASFTPGRREGKPVITSVVYGVIFNPASAAASGPNATPRLKPG
jgi:hypothetical protein